MNEIKNGDKINVMYRYKGEEIKSEGIFLGRRNETYMYSDDPKERARDEKFLVQIQTPDNKEIVKELDNTFTPKEYPEINYCDNLETVIYERERTEKYNKFLEPIYLGKVYMHNDILIVNNKSFTAAKINGNHIFTNEQLDDIEYQLNQLLTNKEFSIEVQYNWRLTMVFRNNAKERDLYIVGNSLSIENNNVTHSYNKYEEIARVHRPDW